MITCICNNPDGVMAEILAVQPDQYVEPEKGKGVFEIVGKMNDFEKAAYAVMQRYRAAIKEKIDIIKSGGTKSNKMAALETEVAVLHDKRNMVHQLLYFSIQDRLNRWGTSLGVSKGFKIIIPDKEESRPEQSIVIEIPEGISVADLLGKSVPGTEKEQAGELDVLLNRTGKDKKVTFND